MIFNVIFHVLAVIQFYFGFWYDRTYVTEPDAKWRGYEFGGRLSERKINSKNFLIENFFKF